jgi:D-glycero-D-manno-heptose 1,7-bisphosphate phosphatase
MHAMTPSRERHHGATALQARALFVDLAGVLLDAAPTHGCQAGLRAGAGTALRLLDRLDYRIVVLTPCAHDRRRASAIPLARIADLLARERIHLAGAHCLYTACSTACPGAGAPCHGCAPAPGALLHAALEHGIDLAASWLLAGGAQHCTAGQQAGCRTLVVAGDGARWPQLDTRGAAGTGPALYQARDIVDAALAIVRFDGAA